MSMRLKYRGLCKKFVFRFNRFYTWLLRGGMKSCGEGVRFDYPLRLEGPECISIGDGTMIAARTWLNTVAEWSGIRYDGQLEIGKRVTISYGAQISAAKSIVIEDDVTLSMGVVIVDHIHDHRYPGLSIRNAPLSKPEPVRIGKRSFLGVYCLIGPGVQIGEQAVVAANAVVTKDVPSYCIAIGNPARVTRFYSPEVEAPPVAASFSGADNG